jgi:hypothetical protein
MAASVSEVDAFDLPEWLGVEEVTWTAVTSLGSAHVVSGSLTRAVDGSSAEPADGSLACDILACDLAYPQPVLGEKWRGSAHHAWQLGEALLVEYDGRLTLVVPGTTVGVEHALEAIRRLAKAVAAPASRFTVALRL